MFKLGLTGSIAMGKSTTAKMFKDLGCPIFDADAEVHKLYAKGGKAVPLIKAVFPDAVKNGAVERKILSTHMRADPLNLGVLESFIHPMINEVRNAFIARALENKNDIVVFDIPLLYETGRAEMMDAVALVTAPAEIQRQRVMARAGMTEDLFHMLLSRQMPDAEKRKRADFLIYTDRGLDSAKKQVQDLLSLIRSRL